MEFASKEMQVNKLKVTEFASKENTGKDIKSISLIILFSFLNSAWDELGAMYGVFRHQPFDFAHRVLICVPEMRQKCE